MTSVIYIITSIIAIILIAISLFINHQLSLGLIIGVAFSIFNTMALAYGMRKMLGEDKNSVIASLLSLIRIIVLAGCLFLIYKCSDMYGFIGFAIGNILFIVALCIDEGRKMKNGNSK